MDIESALRNYYNYLKRIPENEKPDAIDAFQMSEVLAVCFCMSKEDVMAKYMLMIKLGEIE